jgi:hypothetical protein
MKKLFLGLVLLIPVLSGCFVLIPVDDLPNTNVNIIGKVGFNTNYLLRESSGATTPIICDDFTNNTLIGFTFTGNLNNWEAYMTREDGSGKTNLRTYNLSSSGVNYNAATRKVSFTYTISPQISPLSSSSLSPSIVINPIGAEFLGKTQIVFNIPEYNAFTVITDVVGNCGELPSGLMAIQNSESTFLME